MIVSANTPITPGIIKTVEWLNQLGFETTDSGDGVTNVDAGMACAMDVPNVSMPVEPEQLFDRTLALVEALKDIGICIESFDGVRPCIQASYDPGDHSALIMLVGVDDEMLEAHLPKEG